MTEEQGMPGHESRQMISLGSLRNDDVDQIVRRGLLMAEDPAAQHRVLAGQVVGILFTKTSTRTRTSFTTGALRLGAHVITYGPEDLQTNTGESLDDTARVLSGMLDLLVVRTAGPAAELHTLAGHGLPVVNAMSAAEHPTQALADLTTMTRRFGGVEDLRLLYVGEGNNTAVALALGLARFRGVRLEFRTPPGYGLPPEMLASATDLAERSGARIVERHDLERLPAQVDVVYTTRWQTTGSAKPDPRWRDTFIPFSVDATLMNRYPAACFMHDLPAHRGEEVTAEVLDGPMSLAFEQARFKLYSAMAVLEWVSGR